MKVYSTKTRLLQLIATLQLLFLFLCLAKGVLATDGKKNKGEKEGNNTYGFEDGTAIEDTGVTHHVPFKVIQSAEDDSEDGPERENCYELHRAHIPILPRNNWEGGRQGIIRTKAAAKFVVIRDGGERCFTEVECLSNVHLEEMPTPEKDCSLRENFYIGDDGTVINGRGWDIAPYWYLNGLRNTSITVKFLGSHQSKLPSSEALRALEDTAATGLRIGKLSLEYKSVTMRQILKQSQYTGDGLQKNVETWGIWANDSFLTSLWEYNEPRVLKFVSRKQWSNLKPTKELSPTIKKVEYILISNGGNRCNSRKECVSQIKLKEEELANQYGDIFENFYIGNDRRVYEGRGWGVQPHWYIRGLRSTYISVRFFGDYHSELPPESAIHAFKSLVMAGINIGKVSPNFNLISLRQIYNNTVFLGDAFVRLVEKWEPWSSAIKPLSTSELQSFGILPLITHNEWNEKYHGKEHEDNIMPIRHFIIRESGKSCFTTKECHHLMNSEDKTYGLKYGDVLDNFYIGCDGIAYDGRGWKVHPHLHLKYFKGSYATVNILCSCDNTESAKMAILAFESLIKIGISLNLVSPNYQLHSFRQIYNNTRFLGERLAKYLESSEHWSTNVATMDEVEFASSGLLPVVFRKDWKAREPIKRFFGEQKNLVEFVVVGEAGDRCYKHEDCISEIRKEQNNTMTLYGHILDNFYVGDDGNAYEGTGWKVDSHSKPGGTESKSIFVSFFGEFKESLPDKMALAAFRRLLNHGVVTSRISPSYRIISVRQVCNCTAGAGDMLHGAITKWGRWSDTANMTLHADRSTSRRSVLVPRSRWHAAGRYSLEAEPAPPAEYVTMMDGGDNCFSREDCVHQIRFARNMTKYGVDLENFFVGEDGRAYQGLSWDSRPFARANCTECNFVVVRFIGGFMTALPRVSAVRAFKLLVKWGIEMGKISPDYRVVSLNQLCGDQIFLGESLDYSIRAWDHRWENTYVPIDCGLLRNRLIPTEEWGSVSTVRQYRFRGPAKYVRVNNMGERCYTVYQCTSALMALREDLDGGKVPDNFYIGDDGNVYEGRGWYQRPKCEFGPLGTSINVIFFGEFEDEAPSKHAIAAFRDILLQKGLQSGFISEDFEVRLVPDHAYATPPGIKLKETLRIISRV